MKKTLITLAIALISWIDSFPQATSLTIDCQTPGWLSSMINYENQITLKNIKVTGYINSSDLNFIKSLNRNYSLSGVIDLEDVVTVQDGTIKGDSLMPQKFMSGWKHLQKFIYPKSLIAQPYLAPDESEKIDSIIWTSDKVKELQLTWFHSGLSLNQPSKCDYIYLSDGVELITEMPNNLKITFPKSLKSITEVGDNLTIYSFIDNPESVYAERDFGYGTLNGYIHNYCATIINSTFYIPKGTKEKYLNSDFATMKPYTGNGTVGSNNNVFIEYYDIDSTVVTPSLNMYVGDTVPLCVNIYPNDSLVSWIDYISNVPEIVSVSSDGTIVANSYGETEISVTPHVFIDGLETKTGKCVVNVVAHTEGVDIPSAMTVHIGGQKDLNAKTLPLDISDNQLVYESSDPSVADVTEKGGIIGYKRGTCTITATSVDGGHTATCQVTVTQPVEALTLEKHSVSLKVGETEKLFAQISPATADDKTIIWSSSNEQTACVDASGNVNALKGGETWIKAVSVDNSDAKDSCKVIVAQPVTGIQLDNSTYQLNKIGESFELKATIAPDDASNKNIKWKSSDESVCVVSQGLVVAVGNGACVITATTEDGGYTAYCTVNVTLVAPNVAVTGITLSPTVLNFKCIGGTKQIVANVLPADATNKGVNWMSATPAVCSVSETGLVTALGSGNGVVIATTVDGGKMAYCTVNVTPTDHTTITMGSNGIATFSDEDALDFTSASGVKAYIASGYNPATGDLTMTRVYKVPAGEGLLLKGVAGSYDVPYEETSAYYANLLVGVPTATTVNPTDGDYTNFILANDEVKGIGFYPLVSSGEIGANKAYLQLPTSILPAASRSLRMVFDDEEDVTGIKDLNEKGAMRNEKFFDLQGRRVVKPTRGLYIKDGKKIMVK